MDVVEGAWIAVVDSTTVVVVFVAIDVVVLPSVVAGAWIAVVGSKPDVIGVWLALLACEAIGTEVKL